MPEALTGPEDLTRAKSSSAASLTADRPSFTATGDLLWAAAYWRNTGGTLSGPAGWTLAQSDNGNGTVGLWVKPISNAAGEPATYTFSVAGVGSSRCILFVGRITAADLNNPVDAVGSISLYTGTADLIHPSVTAGTAGGLLLAVSSSNRSSSPAPTFTPAPGMTEVAQEPIGDGSNSSFQVAAEVLASAGATGTRTATMSPAANNSAGFMVVIRAGSQDADHAASDSAALTETSSVAAETTAVDSGTVTESAEVAAIGEPTYRFAIDWKGDDSFTGPHDDVTDRILATGGFTTTYGRDQARAYSPPAAGRAAFTLNNTSGDYSPDRTDSPLAGDILPARPFLAIVNLNGETHTLFRGHLDDYQVRVERNSSRVDATALDALANLQGVKISTPLHKGIRTGEAIGHILDAIDWPTDKRDLDPGATHMAWWWLHEEDAWDALLKLIASEGPNAIVHADEHGRIVYRDRHHRLLREESTTGQAVLTDGAGGYEPAFSTIEYDHGWRNVVNTVSMSVSEYGPSPDPEVVWESPDVRSFSGSLTIGVSVDNPVLNPRVTFRTLTGTSVAGSIVQELGQHLTIELTATGLAAVSELQVHAQPVTVQRTYTVTRSDPASIAKYGARSSGIGGLDAPWAGVHDADAIAQLVMGIRGERLPTVTLTIKSGRIVERLVQQVSRDLSDRVHVIETQTGVAADFYLDQITHRVLPGGFLETEFALEQAPTQPAGVFRFDDPDRGFDDGVFGVIGLDDPTNLFIFDQDGHGFDDGVFAT